MPHAATLLTSLPSFGDGLLLTAALPIAAGPPLAGRASGIVGWAVNGCATGVSETVP